MAEVVVSLDVVLPVLNEEKALSATVGTLCDFLSRCLSKYEWRVVIADNGSTDDTQAIGTQLADDLPGVSYTRLEERGRGLALRTAWLASSADIVAYMDIDLSADLDALPQLVAAIDGEGYDIAIGSRFKKGSRVSGRSANRELLARSYSLLFTRAVFFAGFQDAQCGFKALSRRAANDLLPLVRSSRWFFDTELLLLAEKNGYRIKELPVVWTDDPDSRVGLLSTGAELMRGLLRLRFGGLLKASRTLRARRPAA